MAANLSPVSYPFRIRDLASALIDRAPPPSPKYLTSGRAALQIGLEALAPDGPVLLPDFVCGSVERAVRQAGLRARTVPLNPTTWAYDAACLDEALSDGAGAVITVGYFGMLPRKLPREERKGANVVADLAQVYGASHEDIARLEADVEVFSFGPGKSLPSAGGGLAIGRGAAADKIEALLAQIGREGGPLAIPWVTRTAFFGIATRPVVTRFLPRGRLASMGGMAGEEASDFAVRRLGDLQVNYLRAAEARLPAEIVCRRRNARALAERLRGGGPWSLPDPASVCGGVALRLPLLFEDADAADAARRALVRSRILLRASAWHDYARSPTGADIARRVLTLPTFSGSERAHDAIVACLTDA